MTEHRIVREQPASICMARHEDAKLRAAQSEQKAEDTKASFAFGRTNREFRFGMGDNFFRFGMGHQYFSK